MVIDNFDDNRLTGWTSDGHKGQAQLTETNQQFKARAYWPGVHTLDLSDTGFGFSQPKLECPQRPDRRIEMEAVYGLFPFSKIFQNRWRDWAAKNALAP